MWAEPGAGAPATRVKAAPALHGLGATSKAPNSLRSWRGLNPCPDLDISDRKGHFRLGALVPSALQLSYSTQKKLKNLTLILTEFWLHRTEDTLVLLLETVGRGLDL